MEDAKGVELRIFEDAEDRSGGSIESRKRKGTGFTPVVIPGKWTVHAMERDLGSRILPDFCSLLTRLLVDLASPGTLPPCAGVFGWVPYDVCPAVSVVSWGFGCLTGTPSKSKAQVTL